YYEASAIDGANAWQRFRRITLPMLSPTIFFSLVTGVIGAMQVFTQAMVMTDGGPDGATNFYVLNLYRNGFEQLRMGYASAQAWVLFAVLF
ncbi:ABC transporter permease, partial [Pseudomonas sp. GW704-F3]|uniref:carbohydrate ABC transporter permease n=1 Tax=Pseudomonas sp. GW704-F3 TaxID=2070574 RepID=UPI000CAEC1DE